MQPMPFRRLAGAALAALAVFVFASAAPVFANGSALGEPQLLLDLSGVLPDASLRGPFVVGDVAVFLTHGEPSFSTPAYLWRTDGTAEGTVSIHPAGVHFVDLLPTTAPYVWLTGSDLASGDLAIWRTDGTAAGTRKLANQVRIGGPFAYHPGRKLLFFSAAPWLPVDSNPSAADYEPWVSDGTVGGTHRLKDLVAAGSSHPGTFRVFGDEVAFLAIDPAETAISLWLSDGTGAGTRLVKAPVGQSFIDLRVVDDEIYLVGREADQTLHLWHSDGTAAGTVPLADFGATVPVGSFGVAYSGALDGGRSVWTIETEDVPASLWVSDGTSAGTVPLMPLAVPVELATKFLPLDGDFYFAADDGTTGRELWRTDGTPGGTEVAFETCAGPCSTFGRVETVLDGRVLIVSGDTAHGTELRATDGTDAGTELLFDLCPGPCSPTILGLYVEDGLALFLAQASPADTFFQLWGTDFTQEGTERLTDFDENAGYGSRFPIARVGDHYLVTGREGASIGLWAIEVGGEPAPPLGSWLVTPEVSGYSFKVRFSTPSGSLLGAREAGCIDETLCVSGALPGRSEVFARVVGPKPNGYLWPTLVKFSTSTVEVWVRQDSTSEVRYYELAGARPGFDELPGLFDRTGFLPDAAASALAALAGKEAPPPAGPAFTSPDFPDFRFRVRISAAGQPQEVRQEAGCIDETVCLSGAVLGRSEIFLRVVGPKPNGKLWPTIVKFTTSTVEVWIEQISTGETRYYEIEGAAPGKDDLTGLFDRQGFTP